MCCASPGRRPPAATRSSCLCAHPGSRSSQLTEGNPPSPLSPPHTLTPCHSASGKFPTRCCMLTSVAKKPTDRSPHMPQPKCTDAASSGSSIFSLRRDAARTAWELAARQHAARRRAKAVAARNPSGCRRGGGGWQHDETRLHICILLENTRTPTTNNY